MNEIAIQRITKYIDESLFEPGCHWPRYIFEERTYSRWAAFEIVKRLMDRPFEQADDIIDEFIIELGIYADIDEASHNTRMFSIAAEAATDILHLIQEGEKT